MPATLSFWFGLGLNEVPFVGIYVLVASTALAAAEGDLESPGAKVAAAVAAIVTVGLAVSAWRGLGVLITSVVDTRVLIKGDDLRCGGAV
ncbi:hypothetical protein [Streptomyces sp. NPDC058545]|uniref:hypothetical protein n=1 Tax=Streptomyces sp. NPDC058545 TaxID=3346544 RepID=UPI003657CE2C